MTQPGRAPFICCMVDIHAIVDETNRCGRSKPNLLDIDRDELLTFFGLITMMGIKKLPRIEN